jgi:hypothetical protein
MTQGAFDDELRRAFDTLSDRLRSDLSDQLNAIVEQAARAVEAERATAAAEASSEARAQAERDIEEARSQAEQQIAARLAEFAAAEVRAREQGRAEGLEEAQTRSRAANAAASERLVEATRLIDTARSLSEVLDTLVSCAGREAARAGVLLVRDESVRGWRFVGFGTSLDAAATIELPIDAAGVIREAVQTRTSAASRSAGSAPSFAQLADGQERLAVPLLLDGKPVAVLYADQGGGDESNRPAWTAIVEVLTRHAARALEALTAFRTAQALTGHPGPRRGEALASAGRAAAPSDDEEAARRYARLLVSEIKLYHEPAVLEGRRERDLMTRLGGEIARARVLYEQRVPATVPGAADHFQEELIRTLADGDASLL